MRVLKDNADIAVVGSAIIDVINKSRNSEVEQRVGDFIDSLKMVN
jgi:tryptophan synthase alpha subunit